MSDPYRGTTAMRCAVCLGGLLEPDDSGFSCTSRCGYWQPGITRVDGTPLSELGRAIEIQLHPRRCPECAQSMQIRRWSGLTYDVCARHGVWVADDDRDYFRSLV